MKRKPLVAPIVLIALGLYFLGRNLGWFDWNLPRGILKYWPLVLVGIGVALLANSARGAGAKGFLAGFLLTVYGTFFLLVPLGILGNHDIGRYWGIFPGAVGVGLLLRPEEGGAKGRGGAAPLILIAVGALGLFGAFFDLDGRYWPVILIAAGLLLLWVRRK